MKPASSASEPSPSNTMKSRATGAFLLLALWALFSAKFDAFHLGTGGATVLLLLWLHAKLPPLRQGREQLPRLLPTLAYLPWIIGQMVLSALYVARVILAHPRSIKPHMVAFHCRQPSAVQQVLFANSITLTPGTLTVELEEDRYLVHALTPATAGELLEGKMARRIARLSDPSADPAITKHAMPAPPPSP